MSVWLSKRLLLVSCLALAVVPLGGSTAKAGTFDVVTCGEAPGNANNSWVAATTPSAELETPNFCVGGGDSNVFADYNNALSIRDDLGALESPDFTTGYWRFDAPVGSRIVALGYRRHLQVDGTPAWRAETLTDDGELEGCQVFGVPAQCNVGVRGGQTTQFDSLDTDWLKVGTRCLDTTCDHGATVHSASAILYGAAVRLEENTNPTTNALAGSLFAGGWIKGSVSATVAGSDAFGVRKVELIRDGTAVDGTNTKSCDFTRPQPCVSATGDHSATFTLNTASWADGQHTLQGRVTDVAGNQALTPERTVQIDNFGPIATDIQVRGASDSPQKEISWQAPSAGAPVVGAAIALCDSGGTCQNTPAGTNNASVTLPSEGAFGARVLLTDAAGNVGQSQVVQLLYSRPPGTPPAGDALRSPRLRLTTARIRNGRLRVVGRVLRAAKGTVSVKITINGRRRTAKLKPHRGRFALAIKTRARQATVLVRYKPSMTEFKSASIRRVIRSR